MTTALAGIALEHCTQLKWELVGLGIAHVAAERLSHDGESHLLSGNIFPLEKIHFQAISPDTKRRPAHPATKHRVNLGDVRHARYGQEREDRHVGQRLFLRLSDRPLAQKKPVLSLRNTTCDDLWIMVMNRRTGDFD